MEPIPRNGSQPPTRRAGDAMDRHRSAVEKIEAAEHGLDFEAKETAKLLRASRRCWAASASDGDRPRWEAEQVHERRPGASRADPRAFSTLLGGIAGRPFEPVHSRFFRS